jgi:hypothetical protein
MKTKLSEEDRVVLRSLLTQVLGSLHGAVDFWTTVCLGQVPPDPRAFVLREAEILRSCVVVTRAVVGRTQPADPERERLLQGMYNSCQALQAAFLDLADFKNIELEQIRSATQTVGKAYMSLRQAIERLGLSLDLTLSEKTMTPERAEYFEKVLRGLFDLFRDEREAGASSTPATTGTPSHP